MNFKIISDSNSNSNTLKYEDLKRYIKKHYDYFDNCLLNNLQEGLLKDLFPNHKFSYQYIELPSFKKLISESSKLKQLDILLDKLYNENHRVLIFCQMTKMIDILEEYMSKKGYSYYRMDGSTNIADRRDMVNDFQTNYNTFAFLLSTRAGGLGVNLTAADTVIFYDNDWNPTMDAQATDRVHRIGQTKPVSVYRLVTKNSVEERILKRAKQKQNVQTTVYSGGAFKAEIFKQKEIVELLYTEEEMQIIEEERKRKNQETQDKILKNKMILEEQDMLRKEKKIKREEDKKKKEEDKKIRQEEKVKKIKKEEKDKKSFFFVSKKIAKEDQDNDGENNEINDDNNYNEENNDQDLDLEENEEDESDKELNEASEIKDNKSRYSKKSRVKSDIDEDYEIDVDMDD